MSGELLGGARMQYHLRQVLVSLDALVFTRPEVMVGMAATKFDEQGNLTDEATRTVVRTRLLRHLRLLGALRSKKPETV